MSYSRHSRRLAGFTLIEVLLATSLLAAGMGLAFMTLRGAGVATARAQAVAADSERLRAVQNFVRRQMAGAMPLPLEVDPGSGEASLFKADGHEVQWAASMPGYLSRGGPYMQTLRLVPDGEGMRLEFSFQLLTPDGPADPERPPEVLLRGIAEGDFAIRSLDSNGRMAPWQGDWAVTAQMPSLFRMRLRLRNDSTRFPELVVPLRLGVGYGPAPAMLDAPGSDEADDGGSGLGRPSR